MESNSVLDYKINHRDEIVHVSDSWDNFALENDAPELSEGRVLNRSLWDFITDETTRQLYSFMLKLVRSGDVMRFNFNCDSPGKIRFLEMIITPNENDQVSIQTRALSVKERPWQNILNRKAERTGEIITICSWCNAINTGDNDWKSIDAGISTLNLFGQDKLPALSHGMCFACYLAMSKKVSSRASTVMPRVLS